MSLKSPSKKPTNTWSNSCSHNPWPTSALYILITHQMLLLYLFLPLSTSFLLLFQVLPSICCGKDLYRLAQRQMWQPISSSMGDCTSSVGGDSGSNSNGRSNNDSNMSNNGLANRIKSHTTSTTSTSTLSTATSATASPLPLSTTSSTSPSPSSQFCHGITRPLSTEVCLPHDISPHDTSHMIFLHFC